MSKPEHGKDAGQRILDILGECHGSQNFRVDALPEKMQTYLHDHVDMRLALFHNDLHAGHGSDYLKGDAYLAYLGYLNQLDSLENAKQATRSARSALIAAWVAVFVAVVVGAASIYMQVLYR